MNEVVGNVEGAVYKDGKWLLVMRSSKETHAAGDISMVGGTVEPRTQFPNALEETLKRELREEVGIEIEDSVRYVESNIFTTNSGTHVLDVVFLCLYKSGDARVLSDEVAGVYWLTLEEIKTNPKIKQWTRRSIELASGLLL